jgi:hypothetical protein
MARRIYALAASVGLAVAAVAMSLGSMTAAARQADSGWNLAPQPTPVVLADSGWNVAPNPEPSTGLTVMDSGWN